MTKPGPVSHGQDDREPGLSRAAVGVSPVGAVVATGRAATPFPSPRPTAQIEAFVQVLGEDLAAAFLLQFGGADLYLSGNPREDGALAALVGLDNARALGQLLRVPRRIPLAKPWLTGYLRSRGYPLAEIARTLHVSDVTIRRWLRQADDQAGRLAEEQAARATARGGRGRP
jgi:hypothetical protein